MKEEKMKITAIRILFGYMAANIVVIGIVAVAAATLDAG